MRTRLTTSIALVCSAAISFPAQGNAASSSCPNANADPNEVSVSEYADSLLCVVNETRREWGRLPLGRQRNLIRAAGWQADDMAENDYFSHTSSDGDTLADRLDQAHFIPNSDRWRAGENLAAGRGQAGSPAEIVDGWMNSRDHRVNLLDSGFTMVGIAASRGWPGTGSPDTNALTIAMDLGWRTFAPRR
jgi:uncharacterized protein YkwD